MTQFSSREPFNDDPEPWVCTAPDFERYEDEGDYEGRHAVMFDPRPEYNRPQTNPTNPILTEFRRLVDTTGNGLYVTAWLLAGDLIEEWASYPEDQWHHAMDVLEKILRIYREDKK